MDDWVDVEESSESDDEVLNVVDAYDEGSEDGLTTSTYSTLRTSGVSCDGKHYRNKYLPFYPLCEWKANSSHSKELGEFVRLILCSEDYLRFSADLPWYLHHPQKPKKKERANKYRYQRPFRIPKHKPPLTSRNPKFNKSKKFPLRHVLYVPFLRQNPFIAQILSIDGIANIKEAAAVTTWSVIETALLIMKHMEAKQNEMKALRSYTCKAVTDYFFRKQEGPENLACECDKKEPLPPPFIPLENSLFYNYQYYNPIYVWPYEKDFNIFVGLKAIDEYITLRLTWMKHMNYGIRYDHNESDESSINHVYSIVGCNMRYAYPIGQATFNLVFIIISKYVGADPYQRVSARFFIEGNPIEFIPMVNDHHFSERLLQAITNRKIRYFSKFHLTSSLLHKENSTEEEMFFKKKLMRQYKRALKSRGRENLKLKELTALCGFCVAYDGKCAVHKERCRWDELFTSEAIANIENKMELELNNTLKVPADEIFWPDIKAPMKKLFGRDYLLW